MRGGTLVPGAGDAHAGGRTVDAAATRKPVGFPQPASDGAAASTPNCSARDGKDFLDLAAAGLALLWTRRCREGDRRFSRPWTCPAPSSWSATDPPAKETEASVSGSRGGWRGYRHGGGPNASHISASRRLCVPEPHRHVRPRAARGHGLWRPRRPRIPSLGPSTWCSMVSPACLSEDLRAAALAALASGPGRLAGSTLWRSSWEASTRQFLCGARSGGERRESYITLSVNTINCPFNILSRLFRHLPRARPTPFKPQQTGRAP